MLSGNPGSVGHVGRISGHLLRNGFFDTQASKNQFYNRGTSAGIVMRITGSAIMFACTPLKYSIIT
jgi:hypothetical protein